MEFNDRREKKVAVDSVSLPQGSTNLIVGNGSCFDFWLLVFCFR
jgi:hypothetical protein